MKEAGLDVSGAKPSRLTDELAGASRLLVTMGCGEACPFVPGLERDDWPIEDPKAKPLERVRQIRDEVRQRVERLIETEGWGKKGLSHADHDTESDPDRRGRHRADLQRGHRGQDRHVRDAAPEREDVARWFDGVHPVVVVEDGGRIVGFASTSPYRPRECYAKIAEFSVYVARDDRGRGVGRLALEALIQEAAAAGLHKLVSRIFPENVASRAACRSVGFREVGIYKAHGELEGVWKDCVIVERVVGS